MSSHIRGWPALQQCHHEECRPPGEYTTLAAAILGLVARPATRLVPRNLLRGARDSPSELRAARTCFGYELSASPRRQTRTSPDDCAERRILCASGEPSSTWRRATAALVNPEPSLVRDAPPYPSVYHECREPASAEEAPRETGHRHDCGF